jgi:hypothetical protein
MEQPKLYTFTNPKRSEWRLPDLQDPITGDMQVIRHHDSEPAVTTKSGYKAWYKNGLRHKVGAPAIEDAAFKAYYENGIRHRLDGPALIFSDGSIQWWENGVRVLKD